VTAENTAAKQRGRPFRPGQSGNLRGRPRGSRNKTTLAVEALLEGEAEALTRVCIERAKIGDSTALRIVMERICAPIRERAVMFELPPISALAELPVVLGRIVAAVSAGELLPAEGQALSTMLAAQCRAFETIELAERLDELERRLQAAPRYEYPPSTALQVMARPASVLHSMIEPRA
jgi:hypothetical protein